MNPHELAEVRADLAAVPAPPWHWIGQRGGRLILATTHSGWEYLFDVGLPMDEHGCQAVDGNGQAIYADLRFRDKNSPDEVPIMRCAAEMVVPRAGYDPDTVRGIDNPVARWIQRSAEHVAALIDEVDRLTAQVARVHDLSVRLRPLNEALADRIDATLNGGDT